MKKLCVFCGSSSGNDPKYIEMAQDLGRLLADHNVGLVYGGAAIGVMGATADGVLEKDGKVWGVIPRSIMDLEIAHNDLTGLEIVDSMHERKQKMYDLSDGFLALPGGMGTLDEFCEIITWKQLGYHQKPCWVYNYEGFYDHLIAHLKSTSAAGFLSENHLRFIQIVDNMKSVFDSL